MALEADTRVCLISNSNNKYLRYQKGRTEIKGLVQFTADDVLDYYSHFQVVKADCGDDVFHLQSIHNHKFLVRWSPHQYVIGAFATNADEDKTSWTCTLFEPTPILDNESKTMRLRHVQLAQYAMLLTSQYGNHCLMVKNKDPDPKLRDVFRVLGCVFPRKVAFRNVGQTEYLGVNERYGIPYLEFRFEVSNVPQAVQEIIQCSDGLVCIKSIFLNKFWRPKETYSDNNHYLKNFLVADADDPRTTNDPYAMFKIEVLGLNLVALINMGDQRYCKHVNSSEVPGGFSACMQLMDKWAPMEVINLPY